MLASLRDKSITSDEIVHSTAGYTYCRFNDYRLNPENGNLPQRIMALPLLWGFRFPPTDSAAWRSSDEWAMGQQWFHQMGNDVSSMLSRGRAVSGLMAVALGALVWLWSRRVFGAWGGLLSLVLFVLSPSILANGALMTSDTACALFFLAATLGWWRVLHRISLPNVLVSALAMGGLFVAKMSALLIVPIALVLAAARLARGGGLPLSIGAPRELIGRGRQALAIAVVGVVHVAVVLGVIWSFFGFRYSAFNPRYAAESHHFNDTWEHLTDKPLMGAVLATLRLTPAQHDEVTHRLESEGVPVNKWTPEAVAFMGSLKQSVLTADQAKVLDAAMSAPPEGRIPRLLAFIDEHRILPQAYVFGYVFSWKFAQKRGSFFNGDFGLFGWRSFFPYTVLVKTPLPVFGIVFLAICALAASRNRSVAYECLPLLTLMAVYWAVLIQSRINIGHRHILATYPPLFVLCGAASGWLGFLFEGPFGAMEWGPRRGRDGRPAAWALLALVAFLAVEVIGAFPNYLSYFNLIAGGTRGAYRHLVDSSLDWGQDLPGLKRYIEEHRLEGRAYLSYFGSASPESYKIPAKLMYTFGKPMILESGPESGADAWIRALLQKYPDYEVAASGAQAGNTAVMLLEKPSAFRFQPGTYFISATMLQPLEYDPPGPWGPWNARYEAKYQELRALAQPFLGDNQAERVSALTQTSVYEWMKILNDFDQFRFARLTAFLREREPDDTVNGSILVYTLTAADLDRAVNGPSPPFGPDVLKILEAKSDVMRP